LGFEAGGAAGADDGVVEAGGHVARPDLEQPAGEGGEVDALVPRERVGGAQGDAQRLAADGARVKPCRVGGPRREREVVAFGEEEFGDVGAEDLARFDLDLRVDLGQARQQPGSGLPDCGQRVGEPECAGLPAGGRLGPAGGAVGGGEDSPAVGEEYLSFGGELDAARRAPQQGDPEGPLQRFDLLADRLLGDVQVVGRRGETAPLRYRGEGAQLAEFEARAGRHTRDSTPFRPGGDKLRLLRDNKLRLFVGEFRE